MSLKRPQYDAATQDLASALHGRVIRPGDEGYDSTREARNPAHTRQPQLIVQPEDTADVAAAVRFARDHGLDLAVRSGGHSVPGYSSSDGMLVEFSRMKGIEIDPERRTVRVQPGLTWGEVTEAAHAYGLAVPAGDTGSVGVGGLTTGGGIGWLVRKHGLTIDSLLSVEIVTADGRVLRAAADENADLFWGIRGGGGNFGIITAFEFQAHPVDMIVGGAIIYDADDGESVLRAYADYARSAPEELSTIVFIMHAPPLPFIPPEKIGHPIIVVAVTYAGDLDEGQRVVAPLRALGPVIADVAGPMPYPAIYALTAEAGAKGKYEEVRSLFAHDLSAEAIDTVMAQVRSLSSPFGIVQLRILGGAMARVSSDATAFSHRDAGAMITAINMWTDPSESQRHIDWTKGFYRALAPYGSGVYVNFLSDEGDERIREAYGERTHERLAALKNRYDPTNFFRLNQNIKPAAQTGYEQEAA